MPADFRWHDAQRADETMVPALTKPPTVLVGGKPAANVGTTCTCIGAPDVIVRGSATVLIGGRPAARMLDQTAHGGLIMLGALNVLIGG